VRSIKKEVCKLRKVEFINGKYSSPDFEPGFLTKLFKDPIFVVKIADIVIRASNAAKFDIYGDEEWLGSSYEAFNLLESLGVKFEITGVDNIENINGPSVFVANHMSTLETFIMPAFTQPYNRVTFVIKDTLMKTPFFKDVVGSRDPIVVSRTNPKEDYKIVMTEGLKRLQSGTSVIVFPQTTRSPKFDVEQFNSIGVKLAKKANVPVVPVALKTDAWQNGKLIKDFGGIDPSKKVYFNIDKPMMIKGNGKEEHQKIIDFILDNLKKWDAL
jgi:1-acyl-sn-glycerol-3-phosphate acyltransferase